MFQAPSTPLIRVGTVFTDPITLTSHWLMLNNSGRGEPSWWIQTPDDLIPLMAYLIDHPNLREEVRRVVDERFS